MWLITVHDEIMTVIDNSSRQIIKDEGLGLIKIILWWTCKEQGRNNYYTDSN